MAAGGLIGGAALALGPEISSDKGAVAGDPSYGLAKSEKLSVIVDGGPASIKGTGDNALGLGGTHPAPLPGPTPGIKPEVYANKVIQTAAKGLDDAAQGLGGVHVGPIPAPTPGIKPAGDRVSQTANNAIQTGAKGVGDAAQGLGGVHVGPIPAPTPGLLPAPPI